MLTKEKTLQKQQRKDGKYKNIDLRQLENDDFIIVEKLFAEGKEFNGSKDGRNYKFYSCKVRYGEDEPTFTLYENDHGKFKTVGGISDKIKITCSEKIVNGPRGKRVARSYSFEKVE